MTQVMMILKLLCKFNQLIFLLNCMETDKKKDNDGGVKIGHKQ